MQNYLRSACRNWPIIVVCIFGLVPFLWFRPDYLINGTDVDFALFPSERFMHRLQTWDIHFLGGTDRSNNVASLPFVAITVMFELFSFDIIMVQKLSFVLWLTLIGLSMYFLMSQIIGKEDGFGAALSKMSASLLYMLGFYNIFLWVRLQLSVTTLILMPVFLGLLIAVHHKKIKLATAVSVIIPVAILCGPTGIQPPLVYILLLFTGSYTLYHALTQRISGKQVRFFKDIGVYLILLAGYLVGSAFWFLPLGNFVLASGYGDSAVGMEVYKVKPLLEWVGSVTSFLNVFRFYGDVPWFDGWGGERYFPDFIPYQQSIPLIIASMVIPIIVFSALLMKKGMQQRLDILFFTMMALIGLFLSKGIHPPWGSVYLWLVDNVPFFWIQRAPWQKFAAMTSVCYAVLFGLVIGHVVPLVVNRVIRLFKHRVLRARAILSVGAAASMLVITFVVGFNWVFVSGRMFSFGEGEAGFHEKFRLGFHHKFPDYIYPARDFINQQKDDFKLFFLPDDKTSVYKWGYAGASDVSLFLYKKGLVLRQYGEGFAPPNTVDGFQDVIVKELYKSPSENVARLLGLLNVKYVIQRNDFRYNFFGDNDSPEFIAQRLAHVPGLKKVRQFGQWDFYEVLPSYRAPQIYLASWIKNISGDDSLSVGPEVFFERLVETLSQQGFTPDVLIGKNMSGDRGSNITVVPRSTALPSLEYRRVSATKYILRLHSVRGIVPLVFSEGFHRQWKAYVIPRTGIAEPAERKQTPSEISSMNKYPDQAFNSLALGETRKNAIDPVSQVSPYGNHWDRAIQNNQLPSKSIFQTWFATSWENRLIGRAPLLLPDAAHAVGNGYANSWGIDTDTICQNPIYCETTPESSYDLEVVLEFWPQRLFYLGAFISGGGGALALSYLFFTGWRRRKFYD
jgi:hypothetical protein